MTFFELLNSNWKFQTRGDPVLEKMLAQAKTFLTSIRKGGTQRRLSYLGTSGTGKTMLAKEIGDKAGLLGIGWTSFKYWPSLLDRMRPDGGLVAGRVLPELAQHKGLLILDEIGMGNDVKDFGLDKLITLLELRKDRWLLMTSNRMPHELEAIDKRLSDRLYRFDGAVVECITMSFNERTP